MIVEGRRDRINPGRRQGSSGCELFSCSVAWLSSCNPFMDSHRRSPAHREQAFNRLQRRRDGQHDFDFEIGTWKTHLRRLLNPLTGSTTWVEYEGTTVVRKVWNGRANLVELAVDGPAGHI